MKLFKDKQLKEEIEILDLGIVEAGENKKFSFYVKNDSNAYLQNLEFLVAHSEVKILKAPKELISQAVDELIVEWSPAVTLKEGLKTTLSIKGQELWG